MLNPCPSSGKTTYCTGTPFFFTSFQTPADPGDPIVPDVAHVSRLDAGTGEEIWAYRFTGLVSGTGPAVAGGSVLIGDGGGTVWAVDLESGVAVWRQRVGQRAVGAIAADGERIYAVTVGPEGRVIALEHDPEGSLVRIPSATTLFPLQALLNFAAAAALVGLVSVAMARYLLKPRERPESGERS